MCLFFSFLSLNRKAKTRDSNIKIQLKKIKSTKKHIVPELAKPVRLQEYGVGVFNSALTKSALKKALKKQYITINGTIATTATFIHGGETLCINHPEAIKPAKKFNFLLQVRYEDDHFAIVHKPPGILVSGNSFKTMARALNQNLEQSGLIDATAPQPVHRLDYETTGLLLVGKTSGCIRAFNKMFENKIIKKKYYAITIGQMKPQGAITAKIDGKKSRSTYKVEASVFSKRFGQLNLAQLKPSTGRRHQLRKHLASIGNPILGDKKYGIDHLILNGKGLYLHAYSLKFRHPYTNEEVKVHDPFPQKFIKIFEQLQSIKT